MKEREVLRYTRRRLLKPKSTIGQIFIRVHSVQGHATKLTFPLMQGIFSFSNRYQWFQVTIVYCAYAIKGHAYKHGKFNGQFDWEINLSRFWAFNGIMAELEQSGSQLNDLCLSDQSLCDSGRRSLRTDLQPRLERRMPQETIQVENAPKTCGQEKRNFSYWKKINWTFFRGKIAFKNICS